MRTNSIISLFFSFIFAAGVVSAQDPLASTAQLAVMSRDSSSAARDAPKKTTSGRPSPDLTRVGVDVMQQKPLTLDEAIELALANNKDIEITRKDVRAAGFGVKAARGAFEPRLTGQAYYERSKSPNVSIFSSNSSTVQGSLIENAAVTGYVPKFGTVISGSFNNSRVTTDNPISILSPQESSSLGLSVTQPLFRGRGFDQQRRAIEIGKKNVSLTETQFRQQAIEVVSQVEKSYWDLTFALRDLQIQRDSLRDAKEQLEHNRRLVEAGQLAPIDVVAAETQVAIFEQAVYDALHVVAQAENGLKNLILPIRTDPAWEKSIMPVDSVDLASPRTTITEAMDAALRNRPEIEVNRSQKDINAIDQRFYRDQKKAQIDLVASYTSAGVGGDRNSLFSSPFPLPCTTDPSSPACQAELSNLALLTGNPLNGVIRNRYPTFRVGIQFNIPLFGDKTAGAELGRSLVEAEKLQTEQERIEQGIEVEVRNALQAIRSAEGRLRSAEITRENSAKQYESEQRKLDAGQSDVYRVLERQTALSAARSSELRARVELNKAIAELQRATGNTLNARNIIPKAAK